MSRFVTVCVLVAAAYPLAPQVSSLRPDAANRLVQQLIERGGVPGMQAAVAVNGQLVWSEAFGAADLEQHVPVTRSTRFRIGSVSKSFTAAALARLVDDRRIDLDTPIKHYVPAVPSETMTVRQVAGHLSGIRNYRGAEFINREQFDTVAAAVNVFISDPLLSEPGTKFAYSSYNYTLLSAAIEAAAGRPYLEYLDVAVLKPLQLRATRADVSDPLILGRARLYEETKDGVANAPWLNLSNKWAAGGLLSTAEDIVGLALGVTAPGYLSPQTARLLFTPQRTVSGEAVNYGIGWRTDPAGSRQVWHGGEAMGARAFVLMDPDTRSVVALTSNLGGAPFDEKDARELLAVFVTKAGAAPAQRQ